MRRLIGLFAALYLALIIVGVAHGQDQAPVPFPTPTPPISGGSQGIITELNKTGEIITGAMDRQGTSQVVLVLVVIIVLVIVVVLIRPTIASNTESNRALVQMASGQQAREQNYITLITGLQTTIGANTTAFNTNTEQSKSRQSTDKDVVTVLTSVYDTNLTMKSLINKHGDGLKGIRQQLTEDKQDLNIRLDALAAGLRSLKADVPEHAPRIEALAIEVEEAKTAPTATITPEEVKTLSDTGKLLDRLNKES